MSTIICTWCNIAYEGLPSNHVCPDGITYLTRISKIRSDMGAQEAYDPFRKKYDRLELTTDDRKLLKDMKILVED